MPIYCLKRKCVFDDFDLFLFWLLIVTIGDKKQGGDDTAKTSDLGFFLLFWQFLLFWLPILGVVRTIVDAKQGDDTRKDDRRSCQVCDANCFAIGEYLENTSNQYSNDQLDLYLFNNVACSLHSILPTS